MLKKILLKFFFTGLIALISQPSISACQCKCVNGNVQAICSSTIDLQPICSPQICPLVPPSVRPIQPAELPPLGTTNCTMQQVYNSQRGLYEWKNICR